MILSVPFPDPPSDETWGQRHPASSPKRKQKARRCRRAFPDQFSQKRLEFPVELRANNAELGVPVEVAPVYANNVTVAGVKADDVGVATIVAEVHVEALDAEGHGSRTEEVHRAHRKCPLKPAAYGIAGAGHVTVVTEVPGEVAIHELRAAAVALAAAVSKAAGAVNQEAVPDITQASVTGAKVIEAGSAAAKRQEVISIKNAAVRIHERERGVRRVAVEVDALDVGLEPHTKPSPGVNCQL